MLYVCWVAVAAATSASLPPVFGVIGQADGDGSSGCYWPCFSTGVSANVFSGVVQNGAVDGSHHLHVFSGRGFRCFMPNGFTSAIHPSTTTSDTSCPNVTEFSGTLSEATPPSPPSPPSASLPDVFGVVGRADDEALSGCYWPCFTTELSATLLSGVVQNGQVGGSHHKHVFSERKFTCFMPNGLTGAIHPSTTTSSTSCPDVTEFGISPPS